jgi:hypothetical protein
VYRLLTICFLVAKIASAGCGTETANYGGRTIVVVDGLSGGKDLGDQLHRAGANAIHLQSDVQTGSRLGRSFKADKWGGLFVNSHGDNLESLAREMGTLNPAVFIAGAETGVTLANQLNKHYGIHDWVYPYDPRDKYEVNEILSKPMMDDDGVVRTLRTARQFKSSNREALTRWALAEIERSRTPDRAGRVVIKPASGGGSYGVRTCYDAQDVHEAFDAIFHHENPYHLIDEDIIAMQFLPGREMVVDVICWQGRCVVAEFFDYDKFQLDRGPMFYHWDEILALRTLRHPVVQYGLRGMRRLGNPNGLYHLEIMWEGVKGLDIPLNELAQLDLNWDDPTVAANVIEPAMVEVNHRGRGGIGPAKISKRLIAGGVNEYDIIADVLANPANPQLFLSRLGRGYDLDGKGFIINVNTPKPGMKVAPPEKWLPRLRELESFDITQYPSNISMNYDPGDDAPHTITMGTAWGEIAISQKYNGRSPAQVRESVLRDAQRIKKMETDRVFWVE